MPALELRDIRKSFGDVTALNDVSLHVVPGTVHALLGENGAGKSTLMRIAFGMIEPDAGTVAIDGVAKRFDSPARAMASHIGMVHQHFALVPSMTVAENIALGGSGRFDRQRAAESVSRLAAETGLQTDPSAHVSELGIGAQQRVEILKALSGNARVLILDEPTAVLAPTEADSLLRWIRQFAIGDRSVVLITHKVRDAVQIADHVTVLRQGRAILSGPMTSVGEEELARAMVEQGTLPGVPVRSGPTGHTVVTRLERVTVRSRGRTALADVTLDVRGGELLGIAGVEGSGYHELLRVIAGKLIPTSGELSGVSEVGFIPEDRHLEGIALDMSAVENIALSGARRRRGIMDWRRLRTRTHELARTYDIRGPLDDLAVRNLSGGNQQKLVLARELGGEPSLIVAESPTRGLDLRSTADVRARLVSARDRGAAVVVYSRDLEELLQIADRLVVMHSGKVSEVPVHIDAVTRALVGIGE